MTGVFAAVLVAVAAGLLAGRRPSLLAARLVQGASGGPRRLGRRQDDWRSPATSGARPGSWSRLIRRLAGGDAGPPHEAEVVEACLALAAELQAGAPAPRAIAAVADDWPELFGPAAGRAATGGDVAAALREAAAAPGAASLRAVAAAWEVTDRTGAPLSRVVVAVADSLRTDAAVRREASTQLATVRATARILAILPFGPLLLPSGGDGAAVPLAVLRPRCGGGARRRRRGARRAARAPALSATDRAGRGPVGHRRPPPPPNQSRSGGRAQHSAATCRVPDDCIANSLASIPFGKWMR